jgi:hypothetical protein
MPVFDGTDLRGMGPMTGGGRGWCNLYYRRMSRQSMRFFAPQFINGLRSPNEIAPWIPYVQGLRAFPRGFLGPCRGQRRWQW